MIPRRKKETRQENAEQKKQKSYHKPSFDYLCKTTAAPETLLRRNWIAKWTKIEFVKKGKKETFLEHVVVQGYAFNINNNKKQTELPGN